MQNNWAGLIAIGVFGTVFGYVTLWYARLALDRQRRPAREIIETTVREALTSAREEGHAAGYAEAIEKAVKILDERATGIGPHQAMPLVDAAQRIRALAASKESK
jgi:hypothetical protein